MRPYQRHRLERARILALAFKPRFEFSLHVGLRDLSRLAIGPRLAAEIALHTDQRRPRIGKDFGPLDGAAAAHRTIIRAENLVVVMAYFASRRGGNLSPGLAFARNQLGPLAILK